jgi:ketosteroid isomerase-like protein
LFSRKVGKRPNFVFQISRRVKRSACVCRAPIFGLDVALNILTQAKSVSLEFKGDECEMEERGRETSVSPTERTIPVDPDRTLAAPRFDEKSIQKAQPAVPLTRGGKPHKAWPTSVVVLCVVAGLAVGVLGGLALTLSQRDDARVESSPVPQAQATEEAPPLVESEPVKPSSAPPAREEETVAQDAPRAAAGGADAKVADAKVADEKSDDAKVADAGTEGELRSALGEWLAATNARDVQRQMQFYAPTVSAFYLSRNAPREAVRAEKSRVFAGADLVDVRASSAPDIRLSRDGQTAVMRFRKRYRIEGGVGARSGEVLQELRWRRTPSGWRIVSERDLRVIQ